MNRFDENEFTIDEQRKKKTRFYDSERNTIQVSNVFQLSLGYLVQILLNLVKDFWWTRNYALMAWVVDELAISIK